MLVNAVKTRKAIFGAPLALPRRDLHPGRFPDRAGAGRLHALLRQQPDRLTVVSLALILIFGAMAAFALAEYRFPGNTLLGLFMALGIMIPIRLGTVGILELMVRLGLVNTRRR